MMHSGDFVEREKALDELRKNFAIITDKTQAWNDFLALTKDQNISVRMGAAYALGSAFPHVADKTQAFNILLTLWRQ